MLKNDSVFIEDSYTEISYESANYRLKVGETYTVIFNGTTYECVAKLDEELNTIYLGNGYLIGFLESNVDAEPFGIESYDEDGSIYLCVEESGTYSIEIISDVETVYTIDEKYLPKIPINKLQKSNSVCIDLGAFLSYTSSTFISVDGIDCGIYSIDSDADFFISQV